MNPRFEIERMVPGGTGVTFVSAPHCLAKAADHLMIRVALETLGDALMATRRFIEFRGARELAGLLREIAPSAHRRAALLSRIDAEDGVALVD